MNAMELVFFGVGIVLGFAGGIGYMRLLLIEEAKIDAQFAAALESTDKEG